MVRVIDKLSTSWHDWRLGVSAGGVAATARPGGVYYASVRHRETRDVLDRLDLRPDDVFVDIGCGKGRVLALAAQREVAEVIGIEYEAELAETARAGTARLRSSRAPVRVVQGAAEEFDYGLVTVAYCFNAVEADVLDVVLAKIQQDRAGRAFRIAFVEESPAQAAVFARHTWLRPAARWVDGQGHGCAVYVSAPERPDPPTA